MIREYESEDKRAVAKLISESCRNTDSHELYIFNLFSEFASDTSFVCVEGGAIAGFIGTIAFHSKRVLFVYSFAVGEGFKRNGISVYLFEWLIIYSHKQCYDKICFPVGRKNYLNYLIIKKIADRLELTLKKTSLDKDNYYVSQGLFSEDIYTIFLKDE